MTLGGLLRADKSRMVTLWGKRRLEVSTRRSEWARMADKGRRLATRCSQCLRVLGNAQLAGDDKRGTFFALLCWTTVAGTSDLVFTPLPSSALDRTISSSLSAGASCCSVPFCSRLLDELANTRLPARLLSQGPPLAYHSSLPSGPAPAPHAQLACHLLYRYQLGLPHTGRCRPLGLAV